ncbi:MAG TPA: glycine zipper family protein [Methylomirabilota bacterium]|jgi:uncharacterized protein YcfJ|nr:glycine zipper family protein [Methylomirabilota bacterium]
MRQSASAIRWAVLPVAAVVLVSACATVPTGPSVMVLPGNGKSFEAFQTDNAVCRQWAAEQTGTSTQRVAAGSTIGGAAIGTALGAAAGAAIGAAAGSPATGAAVGAGAGLLGGTVVGAGRAHAAGTSVQHRYDTAFMQCMYARGNQIPMARGSQPGYQSTPAPPPPPPAMAPPPPPPPAGGPPPPPPPR